MRNLEDVSTWLDANFARLLGEHQVPGAAIAVLANGEVIHRATFHAPPCGEQYVHLGARATPKAG
jgi:hypothetical protein